MTATTTTQDSKKQARRNLRKSINAAANPRGEGVGAARALQRQANWEERKVKHIAILAAGERMLPRTHKETGEKYEVCRKLSADKTVFSVVLLVKNGVTADEILAAAEDLPRRFQWEAAREGIAQWSKDDGADLTETFRCFGLVEDGDAVVPSEPEPEAPAKETPKKRGGRSKRSAA
jgi:hypothetical protein